MPKQDSIVALPSRASNWRERLAGLRAGHTHSRILGGSVIMLAGSGLVSAVNFGYNIAVARMLGPSLFGHAAAAVTLLMLASAITLSYQLVCAKFVAKNETVRAKAAVYATLRRRAWVVGMLLGSALIATSGVAASYLNLPSPWMVIVLAVGIAFYIPLGVKRGGLQGTCAFTRLTGNFLLEALVKFLGALVLVKLGFGVMGAVAAISASVILAYFVVPAGIPELEVSPEPGLPASFREGMQAIVFFVGQVVINNIDILLVKHFFNAYEAGMYAAIALVGRLLYFASWSVVSAMFPISAGASSDESAPSVLVVPLLFVLGISVAFVVGLGLFPDLVLRSVFGNSFHQSGLDGLLTLNAAATGMYSLAVVIMAYEMSRKIANTGWMQLLFSGAIMVGVYFFHSSLREVLVLQLVLKVVLLIAVTVPFFRSGRTLPEARLEEAA